MKASAIAARGLLLLLGTCTTVRPPADSPLGFIEDGFPSSGTCRTEWPAHMPDVFPRGAFALTLLPWLEAEFNDAREQEIMRCWCSGMLRALKEGPLLPLAPGVEIYRFTWIPSSRGALVIRIENLGPVHSLHVKVSGLEEGTLAVDRRVLLTPTQWQAVRQHLEAARFWSMDRFFTPRPVAYLDGSEWLFEGGREGRYRVLSIHSPDPEGPARPIHDLGAFLVELSGITLARGELY
ncbi:hypothetical protein ASNO1_58230 [Corallococcus caeni]|uniref:Lipoprotein n=2 Tax=Corallococcus caeni TaxID=3082388 RepID=A0ABQ6R120_9BACT|nr:hypothetical protein ASNO1_58230 [Corallococcus sp. NO1]